MFQRDQSANHAILSPLRLDYRSFLADLPDLCLWNAFWKSTACDQRCDFAFERQCPKRAHGSVHRDDQWCGKQCGLVDRDRRFDYLQRTVYSGIDGWHFLGDRNQYGG